MNDKIQKLKKEFELIKQDLELNITYEKWLEEEVVIWRNLANGWKQVKLLIDKKLYEFEQKEKIEKSSKVNKVVN